MSPGRLPIGETKKAQNLGGELIKEGKGKNKGKPLRKEGKGNGKNVPVNQPISNGRTLEWKKKWKEGNSRQKN